MADTIKADSIKADLAEYNRWQQRFSAPGYLFGTAPNAFLKSQAHLLRKGDRALAEIGRAHV